MGLRTKLNLLLLAIALAGAGLLAILSTPYLNSVAQHDVEERSRIMMESAVGARKYTSEQVAPLLRRDINAHFHPQSVSAYAATNIFAALHAKFQDYSYREVALNPTNLADRPMDWEGDIVQYFRSNPSVNEQIVQRETVRGPILSLSRPIVANERCMECHDTPRHAPRSMTAVYGRVNGFGWHVGEIVGAQIVSVPMSVAFAQASNARLVFVGLYLGVFLLLAVLLNLPPIFRPILALSRIAEDVRVGKLASYAHGTHALTTVLSTDIADSTAHAGELGDDAWVDLLNLHNRAARKEIERFQGVEINTAGDSFMVAFDGPGRAVRCAFAIHDVMKPLGLKMRAGLHTGECVITQGSHSGIALHVAARVSAKAEPGQTLTSRTVKDLCIGSGIAFRSLGTFSLKGLEESWEICLASEQHGPQLATDAGERVRRFPPPKQKP
ncbi:MAG: adenylate/guanylate cyclase domain-containing protein [Pseudomonadota bacterium]